MFIPTDLLNSAPSTDSLNGAHYNDGNNGSHIDFSHFTQINMEQQPCASMRFIVKLDLTGSQTSESCKTARVQRAYTLMHTRSGISIPERMLKNHQALLQRLHLCPLLPPDEKAAIDRERAEDPYLTLEEIELVDTLLRAPWKLSHTTNSIGPILQEQELLSLHHRKLEGRETKSNANTPDDGTVDFVFLACSIGETHSPDFLENADSIIEMDWNVMQAETPEKLAGAWGGDHFFRYQTEHRCSPRMLAGTQFHLIYKREVTTEELERHSVKEYWFIREDGSRLLFTVRKGDETSIGTSIPEAMLLRFIELVRLAGPKFRRHVLDRRHNLAALVPLFEIFFSSGEFEIRVPGTLSLKNRSGIRILSKKTSAPLRLIEEQKVLDLELQRACQKGVPDRIVELVKQGANLDGKLDNGCTLIVDAIKCNQLDVLKCLLDMGAEAVETLSIKLPGEERGGNSPLDIAVCYDNLAAVQLLVGHGSQDLKNPAVRNLAKIDCGTVLTAIKYNAGPQLVTYLLNNIVGYPSVKNYALIYCCIEKKSAMLDMFLKNKLDLNWRHTDTAISFPMGTTALIECIKSGFIEGLKILLQAGADIRLPVLGTGKEEHEGYSPLMMAVAQLCRCAREHIELSDALSCIEFLISSGADIAFCNWQGKTAYDVLKTGKFKFSKIEDHSRLESLKCVLEDGVKEKRFLSLIDKIDKKCRERIYLGHAVIIAKDDMGDRAVLLYKRQERDWVFRLSFPCGMQQFAFDASICDAAKRQTLDLSGIDLSKATIKAPKMLFSESSYKDSGKETHQRQEFHLFELEKTLPTIDLRLTRDCLGARWIKLKDIPTLHASAQPGKIVRNVIEGTPVSPVAVEILRPLTAGVEGDLATAFYVEKEGFTELSAAVKANDADRVLQLINMGVDPNCEGNKTSDGTPLMQSFYAGNVKMARLLVSLGSRIDVSCMLPWFIGGSMSLLTIAIRQNSPELVEFMAEIGAPEFNDPLSLHQAACEAAKSPNPALLGFFLKRNPAAMQMSELLAGAALFGRASNVAQLLCFNEYGPAALKAAMLSAAKCGEGYNKDYIGTAADYLNTLQMLFSVGSYDDETLASMLSGALKLGDVSFIQQLVEEGAADYFEDSSTAIEQLCWAKLKDKQVECHLAKLLRSRGKNRYSDYFARYALEDPQSLLWQQVLATGDLTKKITLGPEFLEEAVRRNAPLQQLVQQGISIDSHCRLGKTMLFYLVKHPIRKHSPDNGVRDALLLGANPFQPYFCQTSQAMKSLIELVEEHPSGNRWLLTSPLAPLYEAYRHLKNRKFSSIRACVQSINSVAEQKALLNEITLPFFSVDFYSDFTFESLLEPKSIQADAFYQHHVRKADLKGVELFWLLQQTFPNFKILCNIDKTGKGLVSNSLQNQIIRSQRQLEAHINLKNPEYDIIFKRFPSYKKLLSFIVLLSSVESCLEEEKECFLPQGTVTRQIMQHAGFDQDATAFALAMLSKASFLNDWVRGFMPPATLFKQLQSMRKASKLSISQCRALKMLVEVSKEYGRPMVEPGPLKKHSKNGYLKDYGITGEIFDDVWMLPESANCAQLQLLIDHSLPLKMVEPMEIERGHAIEASFYHIKGNPAPSQQGRQPISLPIARVPDGLQLTYGHLGDIFELANAHTCNTPYPLHANSFKLCGLMIHRSNHNGTHGARQARYLQQLFALIAAKGSPQIQVLFASMTEALRLNLMLGAYFLRAGRVDESSHTAVEPDDYYTRSAMIYAEYAQQLGVHKEMSAWVQRLIVNSCKPEGVREVVIDKDPLLQLGYQLLTLVHEMDLVRCYGERRFTSSNIPGIKERLLYLTGALVDVDPICDELLAFTRLACDATGLLSAYHQSKGDRGRFAICSTSGKTCWNLLSQLR